MSPYGHCVRADAFAQRASIFDDLLFYGPWNLHFDLDFWRDPLHVKLINQWVVESIVVTVELKMTHSIHFTIQLSLVYCIMCSLSLHRQVVHPTEFMETTQMAFAILLSLLSS